MKRLFDLVAAVGGLAVLWPLFAVVAVLIKLEDGGPIFYRQRRVGHKGKGFRMWKFRSMVPHADQIGGALTIGSDRRITRTGKWLRSLKIDELPQLLNVVAGQMSFVGPRPEVPQYVELYEGDQRRVLDLQPGITDPASLEYFDESTQLAASDDPQRHYREVVMPHKIQLNLDYAARASFWTDLNIILRTLARMLRQPTTAQQTHPLGRTGSEGTVNDPAQANQAPALRMPRKTDEGRFRHTSAMPGSLADRDEAA